VNTTRKSVDGTEYDMTNFSGVMRQCLILVMNRIDKVEKDADDFWKSQKQIVPLRQAIEKFYRWQSEKYKEEALPLWVFGEVALRELEQGTDVNKVVQMFSLAVKKRYTKTMYTGQGIYRVRAGKPHRKRK